MEYKIIEVAKDELLNMLAKQFEEGWLFSSVLEVTESNYTGKAYNVLLSKGDK